MQNINPLLSLPTSPFQEGKGKEEKEEERKDERKDERRREKRRERTVMGRLLEGREVVYLCCP